MDNLNSYRSIMQPMGTPYEGSSLIHLQDAHQMRAPFSYEADHHFDNLAFHLPQEWLNEQGQKLWKITEREEQSYSPLRGKTKQIIQLMSMGFPDFQNKSGTSGSGSSPIKNSGSGDMYSSAMSETYLNTTTAAISLLLLKDQKIDVQQPNGMLDAASEASMARTKKFVNAYFGGMLANFASELEKAIGWATTIGNAVRKIHTDPFMGYITSTMIEPGYFFDGNMDGQFYHSPSWTHKFFLEKEQIEELFDKDEWRTIGLSSDEMSQYDDDDSYRSSLLQMQGRTVPVSIENSQEEEKYPFYEKSLMIYIPEDPLSHKDGRPKPYLITFGRHGGITKVVRNWDKADVLCLALEHTVKYELLPSLSGQGIGLAQLSGQNARAATVLQRSLIDSALLSVRPSLVVKETAQFRNHTLNLTPGQATALSTGDDNIKNAFDFVPNTPPSGVLLQLKNELEDNIRKISTFVTQDLMNLASKAPTGSVLSILQRMEMLPNSILQRIYNSFCKELRIFKRKFYEWLPDGQMVSIPWDGDMIHITKQDFSPQTQLTPCGNFSHESSSYKLVRAEWVVSQARLNPDLHDMSHVLENLYKEVGLDEKTIQFLMRAQETAYSGDPLTENVHMLTSKPVKALLPQDHDSHIAVHTAAVTQDTPPQVSQAIQAHIQEHKAYKLLVQLQAAAGVQVPADTSKMPMEQQNHLAVQLAKTVQQQQAEAAKQAAAQQPPPAPPPMDPSIVGMAEVKSQKEIAEMNAHVKLQQMQLDKQKTDDQNRIEMEKLKIDMAKLALDRDRFAVENRVQELELQKEGLELDIKQAELNLEREKTERGHRESEVKRLSDVVDIAHQLQHTPGGSLTDIISS